jgi:transcriptional regulator with XRE-family HTH domain
MAGKVAPESPLMAEFCDLLRQRMAAKGLSVSELCRDAGVGRQYLHRVLNGEQEPTVSWMQKVGKEVGIRVKLTLR